MSLIVLIAISEPAHANDLQSESGLSDGTALVQKLCGEYESWNDYTCNTELHNYKPDKTTISSSRFFFKKGPFVRIEVIGGGFRDGSVIIRRSDGKVVGKGGGWMGGIQMNFDPDSRMFILPSGTNVTKADLPELFEKLKGDLDHGYSCKTPAHPVDDSQSGKKALVLEVFDTEKALKSRIYLSAEDHLPIRWESYLADKLRTCTIFKNLKINAGLTEELFKL